MKELTNEFKNMFPALEESEDGKMKKIISDILLIDSDEIREILDANNVLMQDIDAWLEKQCEKKSVTCPICGWELEKQREQKPANKIEPKFKAGDWVVSNRYTSKPFCITKICDTHYLVDNDSFIPFEQESDWRLWTIQDAKDGDILYAKGSYFKEYLFMFSSFTEDNVISTHFGYDVFHGTFNTKLSRFGRKEDFVSVIPATKEQRDLLFQKMKEAGYEWDVEKKELRKVEQKLIDKIQPKFKVGDIIKNKKNGDTVKVEQILSDSYCYSGWDGAATIHSDFLISDQGNWELVEQKPADNEMIEILRTEYEKGRADAITEFQKEWSEEDERNLYYWLDNNKSIGNDKYRWLLSLKDRVQPHNTWKPSKEQMKALHAKLSYVNVDRELVPDIILESLYNDLKKLKG